MTILVIVLACVIVLTVPALAVAVVRLRRTQVQVQVLEARLATQLGPMAGRNPRALQAAGKVVRTVVDTATRVRQQGVGGMLVSSIDDLTRWALEERTLIRQIAGPDGTVTILFSDIEDSTALNESLGDERWVKLLGDHDRLVRSRVEHHGGRIVKSQGDGFMVVFPRPEDAVGAGVSIQQALDGARGRHLRRTPIRVRMGLHTGTAIERDGDWFGRNVAMAARVAAQAQGGQILVTEDVRQLLGDDVGLEPGPQVELKGLAGAHQLWAVAV
ncbi:adenylate/guanylate cyclase domain-containing protein [Nocardioides sp.]|uniref:adenylate/guanylate cyclase domain-containing protein n=1 Tax=Nocardioides sp. TaxID=35761 RepID=UPI00273697CD|nr:adenylate/guanylate cyclase domain-containing protein [Nocardioides sp.]MDP3894697.1 adenylate/guanylate cyclase domain-containing protein [Nocardioides sp.]